MRIVYKVFIFLALLAIIIGSLLLYKTFRNELESVSDHLSELSGIQFDRAMNLWGINDSGNPPELYQIDSTGNITRTIRITNAKNIDWEDMTQDDEGHFFIGDFGNNLNKRRVLTIYKIENPVDIKGNKTRAEIIKFKFSKLISTKQIPDSVKNYDIEAFTYYKKELYLFTKNRTKPFDGYTHLYKMGPFAANHTIKYISKFKTCTSNKYLCWITSAAMSPDRTKLALLSSNKIFLFKNWKGDDFFSGEVKEIDLGLVTQKEAITFYNDSVLIYADEKFKGIGGNVYYLKLNE